ncbi:MAG: bacillithiol biosynthesis cysteine-adding enzyme BshC, partial [Candidatus Hydrogenedentes bacterium]|nr:bacillithiol biosynthesis cysteine-adding enzyme BshC [Candidatus Hydrogenedentota bacterium]
MASLAAAYKAADPAVAEFFQLMPGSLLKVPPAPGPWAIGVAEAIREYNAALGAEKSFAGNEAVVITGQQPGLFTGPLYTVLKAITAIQLAARLQDRHGVPCVPVFWVGSEDHDFEEVRSAHVLTKDHAHRTLTYSPAADVAGMPMYRVPVEPTLHGLVDQLAAEVPGSEWREEIEAFLHESLDASDSFADWTARLLARLFRDTPLVLFAPHLPAARAAAATVIRREIDAPLHSTDLVNGQGARLQDLGYPPQVVKGGAECNFFLEVDQRRRKVTWQDEHFVLPELSKHFSQDELRGLTETDPGRFSPNVALRPVVQQALFPAAAYVAGPGEIAYWAQLKPVFNHFGLPMPCVYPRADATITSIKLNKIQRKLGLALEDLRDPADQIEDRALRSLPPHPALPALSR